jgi:hypothetical protein
MLLSPHSVLALGWVCSFFAGVPDATPLASMPPMTASIRTVDGAHEVTTATLEELDRTKTLRWEPVLSYAGVSLEHVVATFRIDGPPTVRMTVLGVFEKLASTDPSLMRPPTVVLTAQGADYRGVVESLSYQCTSLRCDVKVAILQGGPATVRPPEDEEGWQWGPRQ